MGNEKEKETASYIDEAITRNSMGMIGNQCFRKQPTAGILLLLHRIIYNYYKKVVNTYYTYIDHFHVEEQTYNYVMLMSSK